MEVVKTLIILWILHQKSPQQQRAEKMFTHTCLYQTCKFISTTQPINQPTNYYQHALGASMDKHVSTETKQPKRLLWRRVGCGMKLLRRYSLVVNIVAVLLKIICIENWNENDLKCRFLIIDKPNGIWNELMQSLVRVNVRIKTWV